MVGLIRTSWIRPRIWLSSSSTGFFNKKRAVYAETALGYEWKLTLLGSGNESFENLVLLLLDLFQPVEDE